MLFGYKNENVTRTLISQDEKFSEIGVLVTFSFLHTKSLKLVMEITQYICPISDGNKQKCVQKG